MNDLNISTIPCRTCHTIMRPADVELAMVYEAETIVLRLDCDHGECEYRGRRPSAWLAGLQAINRQMAELPVEEGPIPWTWTWWDTDALAQEAAYMAYEHTRPIEESWDPPPLTFICACGVSLKVYGVSHDDYDDGPYEGWRGACAACGIVLRIDGSDGGRVGDAYAAERSARYREACALWEALRPPKPEGVAVASLVEADLGSEDTNG